MLDISFEVLNDVNLDGSVLGDGYPLEVLEVTKDTTRTRYMGEIVCCFPKVIKLGIYDGEVLGTILVSVDGLSGKHQKVEWG